MTQARVRPITGLPLAGTLDGSEVIPGVQQGSAVAITAAKIAAIAALLVPPGTATKESIGLGNVANLSPANMPVSTAQAAADAVVASNAAAATLVVSNATTAVSSALAGHTGNTANPHATTKAQIGLGSVDNLSAAMLAMTGNAVGDAISGRAVIGLSRSPFDKGAGGFGATDDTTFIQQCINEIQLLQNNQFISHGIIDGRGGTFKISAPLTMSGSPYQITFQNMALIPAAGLTTSMVDLSGTTATSTLKWINIVFNGYNQVADLVKMGPKTQGNIVRDCSFFGFTSRGFFDPSTVAGTENRIVNNLFQGGSNVNQGTGIELRGNDSEIWDNVLLNVNTCIRLTNAAVNISRNHGYSVSPNTPIAFLTADTGSQIWISDNYIDCAYLYINNPSDVHIHNNKFFMTGTVGGFYPIQLRPTASNQTLKAISIVGNEFTSLFAAYYPVTVITNIGTIGTCDGTVMAHNTFNGFYPQATEPFGGGFANNVSNVNYNFAANIPWGTLKRIWGASVNSGAGYVTTQTISGTVGFLNFSVAVSGNFTLQGSVNDNFI